MAWDSLPSDYRLSRTVVDIHCLRRYWPLFKGRRHVGNECSQRLRAQHVTPLKSYYNGPKQLQMGRGARGDVSQLHAIWNRTRVRPDPQMLLYATEMLIGGDERGRNQSLQFFEVTQSILAALCVKV